MPSTVKSKDKKYWYERRVQFEASLSTCNAYKGEDLKDCYEQIRIAEQNKNKIWNEKIQQDYAALERMQEHNKQIDQYNLIRDVVKTIAK